MIHKCDINQKIESGAKITNEESKFISNIVRQEINFMIRNSIMMTPSNYEKWFLLFCYTIQTNQKLNDLELIGLYKEFYDGQVDEVNYESNHRRENAADSNTPASNKLKQIAKEVDESLQKIIESLDQHNDSIDSHTEVVLENSKMINQDSIGAALEHILKELNELKKENGNLSTQLSSYHQEISSLNSELSVAKTEAEVDFLTGLVNRRRFERALDQQLEDLNGKQYPFSIIMLDVDDFKQVNDRYGHPVGDDVLQEIAIVLKTFLRANAIAGRVGGEEFSVILPGSHLEEAKHIAERLRHAIDNRKFPHELKVTASFGATEAKANDSRDTLFTRVDKALYNAKKAGKNIVISVA